jgi:hypothetical protein
MGSIVQMTLRSNIPGSPWLLQLRRWLNRESEAAYRGSVVRQLPPPATQPAGKQMRAGSGDARARADNVVDFPLGNRNTLAELAHDLAGSIDSVEHGYRDLESQDRILLVLTTGLSPRLWIDSTAHVELCDGEGLFRVVLGETLDTRVSLETTQYEKVRQFVWDYLLASHLCSSTLDQQS